MNVLDKLLFCVGTLTALAGKVDVGHEHELGPTLQSWSPKMLEQPRGRRNRDVFIVDTGSGESAISADFAYEVHLISDATDTAIENTGRSREVTVPTGGWSMDAFPLRSQKLLVVPSVPASFAQGIIGADVLSRFGAVRFNFAVGQVILSGPESTGQLSSSPVAQDFIAGFDQRIAAMKARSSHDPRLFIRLQFGASSSTPYLIDTGATISSVVPAVAKSLHLRASSSTVNVSSLNGSSQLKEFASGKWFLGRRQLPNTMLVGFFTTGPPKAGLLGNDVLTDLVAMVVDYRDRELLFKV